VVPPDPESNDPVIVECPTEDRVRFFVRPDTSHVVYACGWSDTWFDEDGESVDVPSTCGEVVHLGAGGIFLCDWGLVDASGTCTRSTSWPDISDTYARWTGAGFALFEEDLGTRRHTPFRIALDGTLTLGTPYAVLGDDVTFVNAAVRGTLSASASGALYRWYLPPQDDPDLRDLIARETASGYQIVYDETEAQIGKYHASYFVTGP
jgi:hypothetical protein